MTEKITAGIQINAQVQGEESIKSLSQNIQKASEETEKLHALSQAKTTLGLDVDQATRQEIEALDDAFLKLKQSGAFSQAQLAHAAQLHQDKLHELNRSLNDLRPGLNDVVSELQGVVTQAGGLAYAAREAMNFETAMAGVKKVTEGTPEEYERLIGSLKTLSSQLGIMPDELAKIAATGGQMGIAMERLPEFTEMAAHMSVAFGMTADQAGEMAAKTANVFGLQIDGMRDLGDSINTLGNTTAATESEIAEVLMRIGGSAKQFGLSANEAAALGAAFISLGKTPEVAGTAINALLQKLQNSKNGTAEFQAALKDLGLSAEELAAQITSHPQQALNDFLNQLSKLDKQSQAETIGQLFGAEYADDIALLTGSLNTYADALNQVSDRQKTFGAMQKETDAALSTSAKKIDQARANISNAAIELGNALLPAISTAAHAVGGVAKSVSELSAQFPLITQLATLFLGAKVAINAYQSAMRLMGQDSKASLLQTEISVQKLKLSLLETSAAAQTLSGSLKNALKGDFGSFSGKTQAVGQLKTALMGAAQSAIAFVSAWEMGKGVGDGLYQESESVRAFGDELARAVAYLDAVFTERTFDDVAKHFQTTKDAIAAETEAKKAAAIEEAQINAEAEKRIAALKDKRESLNQAILANENRLKQLSLAGLAEGSAALQLSQNQEALRQALNAVNNELGKQNAAISETSPLFKQRQALESLGLTAEQVTSGISQDAQNALNDFRIASAQFGLDAQSMSRTFQAALQKMDSPEAVAALKESLKSVGQEAGLTEAQIRAIGNAAPLVANNVQAAFEKIGIDSGAVMTGVSADAEKAMADFQAASQSMRDSGVEDSRLIAAGFEAMMEKLQSPEEFTAFKAQLAESGDMAYLTQDAIERLNRAAQEGAHQAASAYDELTRSLKNASNTSDLQQLGNAAKDAMEKGSISAREYQEILNQIQAKTQELSQTNQTAASAQENANKRATESLKEQKTAQDAAKKSTDDAKKSTDESAKSTEKNTKSITRSIQSISDLGRAFQDYYQKIRNPSGVLTQGSVMQGVADTASGIWQAYVEFAGRVKKELQDGLKDLNESFQSGENLAQSLARAENLVANHAQKIDKTTLNHFKTAIDQARQKMQGLAQDAEDAARAAQKELLNLQGKSDAVEKMELEEKIKDLEEKRQEARKMGNQEAAASYQQAIHFTQQSFTEKQRQKAEEKAREAAEKQAEKEAKKEQEKMDAIEKAAAETEAKKEESFRLPETNINLNDMDFSQLSNALSERDKALVDSVKNAIMSELTKHMKNRV